MPTLLLHRESFNYELFGQLKSEDAPDNSLAAIADFDRVERYFSSKTQPSVSS